MILDCARVLMSRAAKAREEAKRARSAAPPVAAAIVAALTRMEAP